MEANVFMRTLDDGRIEVYHTEVDIIGSGNTLREARLDFMKKIRKWAKLNGYRLTTEIVAADK